MSAPNIVGGPAMQNEWIGLFLIVAFGVSVFLHTLANEVRRQRRQLSRERVANLATIRAGLCAQCHARHITPVAKVVALRDHPSLQGGAS